jgi:predicted dienelactone hydrolase
MPMHRKTFSSCLICVTALMFSPAAFTQVLPSPTGPFPIGRLRLHWVDDRRSEALDPNPRARREINIEVWYPADANGSVEFAGYIPELQTIRATVASQEFVDEFDSAADLVKSGQVKTHSHEGAKIAAMPARFPVLIFSHGLGVPPEGYTSQTEDLATHGFIVVAIEHTYDAFVSVFPDRRVIDYEEANWDSKKGETHAAYTRSRVDVWADDILFVVGELLKRNRARSLPILSGRLDVRQIGAFGHSMGGLAALAACQRDPKIRACLDEDSLINNQPFTHPERRLKQPYMTFLTSSNYSPTRTDAQLARAGVSRTAFNANVLKSQGELKESLRSHGSEASLVVLRDPAIEHMNFSDFRILQSQDQAQLESSDGAMTVIRDVVLSFFEQKLVRTAKQTEQTVRAKSSVDLIPLR